MLAWVDDLLNRTTMYRLVLYYLITLLVVAGIFGIGGLLAIDPANLSFSVLLILATCYATNIVFARTYGAIPNVESVYITGLILALIIPPAAPSDLAGVGFLIFASAWAMASKYIFALGKKHLFNPAAFGVALSALLLNQSATWWVAGNLPLLPFVLVGGLLIVRKIRRFDLVLAFALVALTTIALTATGSGVGAVWQTLIHSSFFFLALVMLTEPLTMPPTRVLRFIYGAIVGFLFAPNIHLGSFYFTPELALLVGNIFVYIVAPKGRYILTLTAKNEIAQGTWEFVFTSDRPLRFHAGQYLEWTLAHEPADSRGNRRYFTIASSPTEREVRLGVRVSNPASTYKRALLELPLGERISVSSLAGDFVLPKKATKKLAFIAGGIGITPVRSMVQYLVDTQDKRALVLLYSNKTAAEVAYVPTFNQAASTIGMKTIYALTDEKNPVQGAYMGPIDAALISREIPDYRERTFYISGPHTMVEAFKNTLGMMGVSRLNIKIDYFPGFA